MESLLEALQNESEMETVFWGIQACGKIKTLQYFCAHLPALSLKPASPKLASCCQSMSIRAMDSLLLWELAILQLQEEVSATLSSDLANQYLTQRLLSIIFLCFCPTGSDDSFLTIFILIFPTITLSSLSCPCCSSQLTGGAGGFCLAATRLQCPSELLSKGLAVNDKNVVDIFVSIWS